MSFYRFFGYGWMILGLALFCLGVAAIAYGGDPQEWVQTIFDGGVAGVLGVLMVEVGKIMERKEM